MLQFFRKYQKSLLIVITMSVIFSFLFSGVYSAFSLYSGQSAPVATTWHGRGISQEELQKWVRFISLEKDGDLAHEVNLLNPGILVEWLFRTGVMQQLFTANEQEYTAHYQKMWSKIKEHRFYRHPQSEEISAKNVWKNFSPNLFKTLDELPETFSAETFPLLLRLYEEERAFPPSLLKRMLLHCEKQANLPKDLNLPERNVALFGFVTAQDWFPAALLEQAALFLMNAAEFARDEGILCEPELVKKKLSLILQEECSIKKISPEQLLLWQIHSLGLQQHELANLLASLYTLERYFDDLRDRAQASSALLEPILTDSLQSVVVREQSMAPQFCWRDPLDYAYFSLYKRAVSPDTTPEIAHYFPVDIAKKSAPKLVHRKYTLQVSYISVEECSAHIPLQSIWSWQLKDLPFQLILRQFPQVDGMAAVTKDERRRTLQSLDPQMQREITSFSQRHMLQDFPDLISHQLQKKSARCVPIKILADGRLFGLNLVDPNGLAHLLAKAPLKGQSALSEEEGDVQRQLLAFPDGKEGFFRIEVVHKEPSEELLTYGDALSLGVLQELFEAEKKARTSILKKTHPDLFASDQHREEINNAFAKALFPEENISRYFTPYVENARKNSTGGEYANTLAQQFCLQSTEKRLRKEEGTQFLFSCEEGEVSPVKHLPFPHFSTILRYETLPFSESEEYRLMQESLAKEVRKETGSKLLHIFKEKGLLNIERAT